MSFDQSKTFLFFGRSGAGKGTQAKKLVDFLKGQDKDRETIYVETGQMFRNFIANHQSYASQRVSEVLSSGGLLPAFMPIWMWSNFLVSNFTGSEHMVFDGVARRPEEAPILAEALIFYKREDPFIIYIDSSRGWCKDRLLERGRSDDTADDIDRRLDWYEENVLPTIDIFKADPNFNFVAINGEQTVDEVHQEVLSQTGLG